MVNTHYRFAVLVLSGVALLGPSARAQTSSGPPSKIYTRHTAFKLPIKIDDKDRAGLESVKLYVKNGPSDAWVCKVTAPPSQPNFTYQVEHDGEYWFSVVTVDKNGKSTPADVRQEQPGLVVVVDTQPPEFDLRPIMAVDGLPYLKCTIKDANPDYGSLRVEYKTDRSWQVLEPMTDMQGMFRVPDSSKGVVRVTVCDRAKNTTSREVNPWSAQMPYGQEASPVVQSTTESHSDKAPLASAAPQAHSGGSGGLQIINSTHASLDYQIDDLGPSGVGKVDVWITHDEGQTWQRLCEDTDKRSPAEIDLPGDGLFGLSLVVTNGNGNGAPAPARGDVPNWWVEVDTTKPSAQLLAVRPVSGDDGNSNFVISWTASDKNLKSEPIDLYYSTQRDGLWVPIVRGLANTGNYRWAIPKGAGQEFWVRMEVSDRAGNIARCDIAQPVVLDFSRPRAHVVGVSANASRSLSGN
ncbi:MAG TPA: hypothetical protein VG013_43635 [Gemmataceae bacterium]|jgi:hypothetical protein|nr:hypothetical protein [Gemmataceae bacterium]